MLVDFSVRNYKSIRDKQLLSLVATKDDAHSKTHLVQTDLKTIPNLLKSTVIYGANASGKTNLIRAFEFMRNVVAESAGLQQGQKLNFQPFKLDKETINQPSEFEITFLDNAIRYQYGFALTAERITEEWLLVYKKAKPQEWFTRNYNEKNKQDTYKLGPHLKGNKKLWIDSTRQNALFLSTAVQLNSEQLLPVYTWIVNNISFYNAGASPFFKHSVEMLQKENGKNEIIDFLISADTSITDIDVVSKKAAVFSLKSVGKSDFYSEEEIQIPVFKHETKLGSAMLQFDEESMGTQRLFCLAAPVLEILKNGKVLIADELDSSLHTLLVRRLVSIFHSPTFNTKGAQLIFSTHDTGLLDTDIFRRDQIWFVEKDYDQATKIYPLSDFSPRKNEALEKGYLSGRYGALPFFIEQNL